MKKIQKTKSWLTLTAGVLGTTSVVTPLSIVTTSCSNNSQISPIEFAADKEYGVTEATYNDLRENFEAQYRSKLELEHGEAYVNEHVDYLEKQLTSLDKIKNQKTHGFTTLTSSMIDFAKNGRDLDGNDYKKLNLRLNRKSNAQWSQLDTIFNNWKGSFRQYMLNSDLPASTINRVMQDAQNKFINLKENLIETSSDVLDGVIKGKELLITCFEDVNDEIALVSATLQLKELMNQYIFNSKDINDPGFVDSCLDKIQNDPQCNFAVGNILTDITMNKLFTITRKDDGNTVDFTKNIVKGYTIFPKLVKISSNAVTNIHSFSIDFGIVKTSYIGKYDKDKLAKVTAHIYSPEDLEVNKLNDGTLDQLIHMLEINAIEYPIYLSQEKEKEALQQTYFSEDSSKPRISFAWSDNKKEQAYEGFFDNATYDANTQTWSAHLTNNSLFNTLIKISNDGNNYKLANDVALGLVKDTKKIKSQNKTIDELFMSICEFSADATINEKDESNKVINIDKFYVNYKNSPYKNKTDGKVVLQNTDNYTQFQDKCVNHSVSDAFFEKVNNKFNVLVNFVSLYDASIFEPVQKNGENDEEPDLESLDESSDEQYLCAILTLVAGALSTAWLSYEMWSPILKASNDSFATIFIFLMIIVSFLLQIIEFTSFKDEFYDPMKKLIKERRNFQEFSESSELIRKLKERFENYVYYNEDDGSYDQKEFETKKNVFSQHTMIWMLDEYRNYSCIEDKSSKLNRAWEEYNSKLEEAGIDPKKIQEILDPWKDGGKYWLKSWGITIGTLLFSALAGICAKKIQKADKRREKIPDRRQAILEEHQKAYIEQTNQKIDEFSEEIMESFSESLQNALKNADTDKKCIWFNIESESPLDILITIWGVAVKQFDEEIWGLKEDAPNPEEYTTTRHAKQVRERLVLQYYPEQIELYDYSAGDFSNRPWDMELIQELFGWGLDG